jgi:hypothetical protein
MSAFYLATVTDRARPTSNLTTILGTFATEHEACQKVIAHIKKRYTDRHRGTNCLMDYTNVCEYLNDAAGETGGEPVEVKDVKRMFANCKTAQELNDLLSKSGNWAYNSDDDNYGWTFKIQPVPSLK